MSTLPPCPQCESAYTYEDGSGLYICPECAHEWPTTAAAPSDDMLVVKDANGTILQDGDSVSVIKDLKVKGSSSSIKGGTKVRNIKLTEANDGHNIACKIDGIGSINLRSEFVRKA